MKQEATLIRARLKTPRAAAIAGTKWAATPGLRWSGHLRSRLRRRRRPRILTGWNQALTRQGYNAKVLAELLESKFLPIEHPTSS